MQLIMESSAVNVCDIGGGANPLLPADVLAQHELNCTILDISQSELDKAPAHYKKLQASIMDADALPNDEWDIVFSQTLAEHLPDGKVFHSNIFRALKPGGYSFHSLPTLYSLPFLVNALVPESVSDRLLDIIAPRDRYQHDKFKAYYSWCAGPSKKMIERFESIGFEVVLYEGLFGHRYFHRISALQKCNDLLTEYLVNHPIPQLTSYAQILLRKPIAPASRPQT